MGSTRVDLPGQDFALPGSLGELLKQRVSIREFLLKPLALEVVGRLLYTSYGLREAQEGASPRSTDRPVPSAGGLYPLELYVAAQAVTGLPDGVYHYDARAHQLELRRTGRVHEELAGIALGQTMLHDANLLIVITAIFQRTMWKYGQRGYRYIWLDAGHLGQNLYLAAAALGLGPVAIGGFFDDDLNRLLELPVDEEEAMYVICVGQPREHPDRSSDDGV
jgi:SagB-type dehydrogenase family enzyme